MASQGVPDGAGAQIERQRPDVFKRLRCVCSEAHWATKWALIRYLLMTYRQKAKQPSRLALTLQVLATDRVPDAIAKRAMTIIGTSLKVSTFSAMR